MDIVQTGDLCLNCQHPINGKYCSHCGQKTSTTRFSFHQLWHFILHGIFHLDHSIFITIRDLALRPGSMLKNYLAGRRNRYFNPFTFCIVVGGINAIILQKLNWHGIFIDFGIFKENLLREAAWNSSLKHFAFRLLLAVPIYSAFTFLFYLGTGYNYIEHIIVSTYLRGEFWCFMILFEPFLFLLHDGNPTIAYKMTILFLSLIYLGWSYDGAFSRNKNRLGLLKGFLVALIATFADMWIFNFIISKSS